MTSSPRPVGTIMNMYQAVAPEFLDQLVDLRDLVLVAHGEGRVDQKGDVVRLNRLDGVHRTGKGPRLIAEIVVGGGVWRRRG
jgi:hypothetical protein